MLPQFEIDQAFDLDEALTMPENSAIEQPEAGARPISAADSLFHEMPTVANGGGRCGVCLKGLRAGGTQVRCGHVFHVNCIALWASINSSCPLCRAHLAP